MKILTWRQFTDLPDGVIYSKYEPIVIDGLYRRYSVYRNESGDATDFIYCSLLAGPGCPPPYDAQYQISVDIEGTTRWGLYDYDRLWAVYEPEDLQAIIAQLSEALQHCSSHYEQARRRTEYNELRNATETD